MANIAIPNTFVNNTTADALQVDANFSEVQNKFNTYAVQTDVAKTVTASHTFTPSQTFSGGLTTAAPIVHTAAASQVIPGATSYSIRDTANANDNLLVSNAGAVTVRNGLTVSAGGLAATGNSTIAGTLGGVTTLTATNVAGTLTTAAQPNITSVGALTTLTSGAHTVTSGGVAVTGNSTITGNLNVTGSITAVAGSNAYVRRTTDLNFTTSTDFGFAFAIGSTEEWEFEYVLQHTNGSAATASFSVTGPAAATGFFGGFSTVSGAPSAVQGAVQQSLGNILVGFTMNATSGYTHIRGYAKGGGTPGNIAINGTASAGTGVLKAGSFVRYSRIA